MRIFTVSAAVVLAIIARLCLKPSNVRIFTTEELQHAASEQNPLLLVVVGRVFDVTEGRAFYGRGDGYDGFANGTDNTLVAPCGRPCLCATSTTVDATP